MNKKELSERDICSKFIGPAIKLAGWAIPQPVVAELLVTSAPAPHLPVTDADHLCCLHQVMRLAMARRITSCTSIARSRTASGINSGPPRGHSLYQSRLSKADISCAN